MTRVATIMLAQDEGEEDTVSNISVFESGVPEPNDSDRYENVEVGPEVKIGMVRRGDGFVWRSEEEAKKNADRSDPGATNLDDTVNTANQGGGAKTKQATRAQRSAETDADKAKTGTRTSAAGRTVDAPSTPQGSTAPAAGDAGSDTGAAPATKAEALEVMRKEGVPEDKLEEVGKTRYPALFNEPANA